MVIICFIYQKTLLDTVTPATHCKDCLPNYIKVGSNVGGAFQLCKLCDSSCETCNVSTNGNDVECSVCKVGYYKTSNKNCVICNSSCSKCTTDTAC